MDSDETLPELSADLAQIARELAMDILPVSELRALHQLDDPTWERIITNPRFQAILADMSTVWHAAANTPERVRIKSATGIEAMLEVYIRDIADRNIPLNQRVEAGKLLARLGELIDVSEAGERGEKFTIQLNIGTEHKTIDVTPRVIETDRDE